MSQLPNLVQGLPGMKVSIFLGTQIAGLTLDRMTVEHRPGILEDIYIQRIGSERKVWRCQLYLQLNSGSSPAIEVSSTGGNCLVPVGAPDEKRLLEMYDELMRLHLDKRT